MSEGFNVFQVPFNGQRHTHIFYLTYRPYIIIRKKYNFNIKYEPVWLMYEHFKRLFTDFLVTCPSSYNDGFIWFLCQEFDKLRKFIDVVTPFLSLTLNSDCLGYLSSSQDKLCHIFSFHNLIFQVFSLTRDNLTKVLFVC